MANDLNKHICIARLGKDPEIKYLPSGQAVANFSVACGKSWKNKEGQKQEQTTWINYVAFGKLAEIIGEYCHKGSRVYLEGELRVRKWQDKNTGQDRYTTEIVASEMQMLDSNSNSNSDSERGADLPTAPQPSAQGFEFDDAIPF